MGRGSTEYVRAYRNGLSIDELRAWLEEQGNRCAVCGTPADPTKRWGGLVIDHDHGCCNQNGARCGQCLRGLLCVACNAGLGQFGDDVERLRKAIAYLERPRPPVDPELVRRQAVQSIGFRGRGQAKLTDDQVRAIRDRSRAGESQIALGREFGVTPASIANAVHRRTYAHVI